MYTKQYHFLIPVWFLFLLACTTTTKQDTSASTFSILDFGAVKDKEVNNAPFIQKAIDACHKAGGGVVRIPAGKFVSGTIFLKDNVSLRIENGAFLLGSAKLEDYVELTWGHNNDRQPYHLIVAQDAKNISIEGLGTIDGRGQHFWKNPDVDPEKPQWILAKDKKVSPLIELVRCRNVLIRDVSVITGGGWNIHTYNCNVVKIQGVNIDNNLFSPNSDGIDITGCHDVMVSDCFIRTCDDGICLKTTPNSNTVERVTVTNCVIETSCVGLKAGASESFHDMRDITFSNCVVAKSHRAIGLYSREGAVIENVAISNIVTNSNAPITLPLPIHLMVERKNPEGKVGKIKNVSISNLEATTQGRIMMTAANGGLLENITLRDVRISYPYIEDPKPYFFEKMSGQYPKLKDLTESPKAEAVLIVENAINLVVDNLQTHWPDQEAGVPKSWQHSRKIQNGILETFEVKYYKSHETEMHVVWAKNVKGGYLRLPMASASSEKLANLVLKDCSLKVFE